MPARDGPRGSPTRKQPTAQCERSRAGRAERCPVPESMQTSCACRTGGRAASRLRVRPRRSPPPISPHGPAWPSSVKRRAWPLRCRSIDGSIQVMARALYHKDRAILMYLCVGNGPLARVVVSGTRRIPPPFPDPLRTDFLRGATSPPPAAISSVNASSRTNRPVEPGPGEDAQHDDAQHRQPERPLVGCGDRKRLRLVLGTI